MTRATKGFLTGILTGVILLALFGAFFGGLASHPVIVAIVGLLYLPVQLLGYAMITITGKAAGHLPFGLFILLLGQIGFYALLGFLIGRHLDKKSKPADAQKKLPNSDQPK